MAGRPGTRRFTAKRRAEDSQQTSDTLVSPDSLIGHPDLPALLHEQSGFHTNLLDACDNLGFGEDSSLVGAALQSAVTDDGIGARASATTASPGDKLNSLEDDTEVGAEECDGAGDGDDESGVLELNTHGEFVAVKGNKGNGKGRPQLSRDVKNTILIAFGWARFVKRKQSTIHTTTDTELKYWHSLLYYGPDSGHPKSLNSPFRE